MQKLAEQLSVLLESKADFKGFQSKIKTAFKEFSKGGKKSSKSSKSKFVLFAMVDKKEFSADKVEKAFRPHFEPSGPKKSKLIHDFEMRKQGKDSFVIESFKETHYKLDVEMRPDKDLEDKYLVRATLNYFAPLV